MSRLFFLAGLIALLLAGCGSHVHHQVRKDETLYSISWRYNQDYHLVAKWNGLEAPYLISEGQWLRIAPPGPETPFPKKQTKKQNIKKKPAVIAETRPVVPSPAPHQPAPAKKNYSTAAVNWQWPAKGKIINKFNSKDPGRQGIDIAGRLGESVYAAAAGKVVYSGNNLRGYGNLLIIKHNDKYLSAYAHNQKILVKEGTQVKRGQLIALMGRSEADRVKLHFQVRVNGKPSNPLRYLPRRGS